MTCCYSVSLGRSPGAVEPGLCVLLLLDTSLVPQAPFAKREMAHRGFTCLLHHLTPSNTHPLLTLSEPLPFALTNGCLALSYQKLVVNAAKESCNCILFFTFFSHFLVLN